MKIVFITYKTTVEQTLSSVSRVMCVSAALRHRVECAQAAVAQPPGDLHVATLPPLLSPTVLQSPELFSVLLLKLHLQNLLKNSDYLTAP